ncbi:entericidin [uncultured Jannaschia sp.]|nr:entericidin [uncultured Jannaschia sp.]
MARLTRAALVLAVALGLAGCETAKGFVQDSENLGDALSDGL